MSERTLRVDGMTDGESEAAVSRILAAINGVEEVRASAQAGTVTVELSEDVPEQMLRAAVQGAGFSVAGT